MRRGMSLVCMLVATISCGTLGSSDVVRARHAREFNCLQDTVHVIEQGDGSLRAWGCGPDTTYVCRSEHLCSPQSRAVVRISGGEVAEAGGHEQGSGSAGTSGTSGSSGSAAGGRSGSGPASQWPDRRLTRDAGQAPPRGAQEGRRDAGATPPAEAVRAQLELRRSDVLVCTGRTTVGVRATYAADGTVDLALQGELHGSPEEDCVRNALRDLRIAAPQHSGVVVHLIR